MSLNINIQLKYRAVQKFDTILTCAREWNWPGKRITTKSCIINYALDYVAEDFRPRGEDNRIVRESKSALKVLINKENKQ